MKNVSICWLDGFENDCRPLWYIHNTRIQFHVLDRDHAYSHVTRGKRPLIAAVWSAPSEVLGTQTAAVRHCAQDGWQAAAKTLWSRTGSGLEGLATWNICAEWRACGIKRSACSPGEIASVAIDLVKRSRGGWEPLMSVPRPHPTPSPSWTTTAGAERRKQVGARKWLAMSFHHKYVKCLHYCGLQPSSWTILP